jgi:hypothetical protein
MVVSIKLQLTMITTQTSAAGWGQLEDGGQVLASLREASARWACRERARGRRPSGVAALDAALGGGWPQGKVCELLGTRSCGRTGVAVATLAAATAQGEVAAWVDGADAFDPASAAAAGVDLDRVLWVRPRAAGEVVRVSEVVLETGGFAVVVLDLGDGRGRLRSDEDAPAAEPGTRRRGPLRLRLARAVERAGAVALVLCEHPWAGASAAATVRLAAARPVWVSGSVDHVPREERGQWPASNHEPRTTNQVSGAGDGGPGGGPVPGSRFPVPGLRGRPWLAGLDLSFHIQRGSTRPAPLADRAEGF